MNQAVGVNHLERRAGLDKTVPVDAQSLGGQHRQGGPDALATGENTVADRLMEALGSHRLGGQETIEGSVDSRPRLAQEASKVGHLGRGS